MSSAAARQLAMVESRSQCRASRRGGGDRDHASDERGGRVAGKAVTESKATTRP